MTSMPIENSQEVLLLLPKDIPGGPNNAFAPSLAAWHRMVLKEANYTCKKCTNKIILKWRLKGSRKIARNYAHHIISQNLADWFGKPKLKRLLACGRAYCDTCHMNEHLRLGGYEFGGALQALGRFRGLEILRNTSSIYMRFYLSDDKKLTKLYKTFLRVVLDFKPELEVIADRFEYEEKAQIVLSWLFYQDVYKELELLNWDKMPEWTSDELQSAVDRANERWWNEVTHIVDEYNRLVFKQ
jgi:hypothetical protein